MEEDGLGDHRRDLRGNWENRRKGKVQQGCKIINLLKIKKQLKKIEATNLKEIKWVDERV